MYPRSSMRDLLYGLQGQIEVDGQTYNGVMPGFAQLSKEHITEVLTFVATGLGNADLLPDRFKPFTPDEVEAAREDLGLTRAEVHELRAAVLEGEQ